MEQLKKRSRRRTQPYSCNRRIFNLDLGYEQERMGQQKNLAEGTTGKNFGKADRGRANHAFQIQRKHGSEGFEKLIGVGLTKAFRIR